VRAIRPSNPRASQPNLSRALSARAGEVKARSAEGEGDRVGTLPDRSKPPLALPAFHWNVVRRYDVIE
jgi:hypothetical protein